MSVKCPLPADLDDFAETLTQAMRLQLIQILWDSYQLHGGKLGDLIEKVANIIDEDDAELIVGKLTEDFSLGG